MSAATADVIHRLATLGRRALQMRSKIALVIAVLGLSAPCAAQAQFVNRYSRWHDLDTITKGFYAAGLVDGGVLNSPCLKTMPCLARMDEMTQCIVHNKLNGQLFAKMIDNGYANDVKHWSSPPSYILIGAMEKLCHPWLEQSRKKQ
jgi:hypothetical protein